MKQQNVDAETGEVVSRDDTVRGYEVAKGQYMIVEDEEIEAVQIESTRTIDIDRFVPKSEIDERYIDSPYYIAPDGAVGSDGGSLQGAASHNGQCDVTAGEVAIGEAQS